jgi:hypothetical protein
MCRPTQLQIGAGVAQSVQCLTTEWTAGVRSPADEMTFPLAYVSRPVLSSTQLPIQWEPGVSSAG